MDGRLSGEAWPSAWGRKESVSLPTSTCRNAAENTPGTSRDWRHRRGSLQDCGSWESRSWAPSPGVVGEPVFEEGARPPTVGANRRDGYSFGDPLAGRSKQWLLSGMAKTGQHMPEKHWTQRLLTVKQMPFWTASQTCFITEEKCKEMGENNTQLLTCKNRIM